VRRLGIIPCTKEKIWDLQPDAGAVVAHRAYRGFLFHLTRSYAESFLDDWVVFSALHGFLKPDDRIPAAYDITFNRPGDPVIQLPALRAQVSSKGLDTYDVAVILCPESYAVRVEYAYADTATQLAAPFRGRGGIVGMRDWLKDCIQSGRPDLPP